MVRIRISSLYLQTFHKSVFGQQPSTTINLAPCCKPTSAIPGQEANRSQARQLKKMVVPAVNTMFIGKETAFGTFDEICTQCGTCIIGETGGICPVTNCHKGLVNGPCGGTNHGKCEIDVNKDCVWTLIYKRLTELDRLDSMRKYQKPRNHLGEPKPGKLKLEAN